MTNRTERIIDRVKDPDVKKILGICEKSRKYPRDAVTDGAVEILAKYISTLEADNERLRSSTL